MKMNRLMKAVSRGSTKEQQKMRLLKNSYRKITYRDENDSSGDKILYILS